jgi:uncharacterized protein (DUF2267 family)
MVQGAMLGAGVIGTAVAASQDRGVGRWLRRAARRVGSDARYVAAAVPGFTYRITGEHPDPDVSDEVIAERVRARLGQITTHLGVPPIQAHVLERVALLEGALPRERDARRLERVALSVPGVQGVESHLHEDRTVRRGEAAASITLPSLALAELCEAAGDAGARDERAAVHAVLCAFTDRLPDTARGELAFHLPADVRALIAPPRRRGAHLDPPQTVADLVLAVLAADTVRPSIAVEDAEGVTAAVIGTLRRLVPEATVAMLDALPRELADLWSARTVAAP